MFDEDREVVGIEGDRLDIRHGEDIEVFFQSDSLRKSADFSSKI